MTAKKQQLLIRYSGDNDFANIVQLFVRLLVLSGTQLPDDTCVDLDKRKFHKERITKFFNLTANTLHEMQTGRIVDFLQIAPNEVFWGDEEVNQKVKQYDVWGNHDSVILYPNGMIHII